MLDTKPHATTIQPRRYAALLPGSPRLVVNAGEPRSLFDRGGASQEALTTRARLVSCEVTGGGWMGRKNK